MRIQDLIKELQDLEKIYGNIECRLSSKNNNPDEEYLCYFIGGEYDNPDNPTYVFYFGIDYDNIY